MITLRDYQQEAERCIFEAWKKFRSTLLVMATGTGKTISLASIIAKLQPKRAMVLAHRDELIIQAKDKIQAVTGLGVEIEKAELYATENLFHRMPVVVSSIQTQISGPKDNRRYRRFDPNDFGLLICDEAHRSTAASWVETINHYKQNPDLKILGVTATADRADGEALGKVYESVAFEYGILQAISDGWLVDITQQYVTPVSDLDYSHIRTTAGDLNEGDLAKVMEAEENIQGICQPSLEVVFGLPPKTLNSIPVPGWRDYLRSLNRRPRRSIMFTVSVAQAEMCANVFSRAMDGVEWVCGATNKDKRRAILSRFGIGETHVVMNCGIFFEGYDNPAVEVIFWARPTKSRMIYTQGVGRSTRPLPGLVDGLYTKEERRAAIAASDKPFCRIIDYVNNSGRHKLVSCTDILGGHITEEAKEAAKEKAMKEGKPVRVLVSMNNAELELQHKKQEAADKARREKEARRSHLLAKVDYEIQNVDPFGKQTRLPIDIRFSRDGRTFSEGQTRILRKLGVNPANVKYKQGQAIIGDYFSKPTPKMREVLTNHGYDVKGWDRDKAKQTLDALAANGWRRPPEQPTTESAIAPSMEDYTR